MNLRTLLLWLLLVVAACAKPPVAAAPLDAKLVEPGGTTTALRDRVARAPLTVLLFFAAECPVQKAHDAMFREIVTSYAPRGVAFVGVVSEVSSDMAAERAEAERRGLGLSIDEDRGAVLADALGVEYSTHVAVINRSGEVLYSGALDSERSGPSPKAEPYLRNALDAALAGRIVEKPRTEALGCPLRKH